MIMNSSVLSFFVGFISGTIVGVMVLALFSINKNEEDRENDEEDDWKEYKN